MYLEAPQSTKKYLKLSRSTSKYLKYLEVPQSTYKYEPYLTLAGLVRKSENITHWLTDSLTQGGNC